MPAACALGRISGKFIFDFGIAERLRTLRYPIFTGGNVTENDNSGTCFLRKCGAAGNFKSLISKGTGGAYAVFYEKTANNI